MQGSTIEFKFAEPVPLDDLIDMLRLARLSAEAIYSSALVKIASEASIRPDGSGLTIGSGSDVGLTVALVFAEIATESLGDNSVRLRLLRTGVTKPEAVPA